MAEATIEKFFTEHFPVIRAKCSRMLGDGDEAADVAQETFLRLWQSSLAEGEVHQRTKWIYQTSTRLAIDRMRRKRRGIEVRPEKNLVEPRVEAALADDVIAARGLLLAVAEAVPEQELEVAILSRIDGLRHNEIADVSNISERTVRRLLSRFDTRIEHLKKRIK